jgi:hypothetical protein
MPKQNRVTPFGTLIADAVRGTLTGNRGCLHDDGQRIRREFQGQRWIICLLDFKGRRRKIMTPGYYTELFFLDEATALAAGHRPCAECQRERFNLFREIWAKANPEFTTEPRPAATIVDAVLHAERTCTDVESHKFCNSIKDLPDGTFVAHDEATAHLVLKGQPLKWNPGGYEPSAKPILNFPARVLTPPSVVRALAAGYPVNIHPSARQATDPESAVQKV